MHSLLAFVLLLTSWSSLAFDHVSEKPEIEELRRFCREHRTTSKIKSVDAPEVGQIAFFPTSVVMATQSRFSFTRWRNSVGKVMRQMEKAANGQKRLQLPHDHGRAAYGFDKRLHGIYYRGLLYLIDGHHRALVSAFLGAPSVPIEIVADWSKLYTPKQFRRELESKRLAYWVDHHGRPTPNLDLCDLVDDPNLQLARHLILRVNVNLEFGDLEITKASGAERPLLIKINQDIPFLEFHVADALRRAGVEFNVKRKDEDLRRSELKYYLSIIREAAQDPSSPLHRVLLLDQPRDVRKLDLRALILRHLKQHECAQLLIQRGNNDEGFEE